MKSFIDESRIAAILQQTRRGDAPRVRDILAKARSLSGLDLEDAAVLLQVDQRDLQQEIQATAQEVKRLIYGNRLVLFAPLYISNFCTNNCLYCGFRTANRDLNRIVLTQEQIAREVAALTREGHKRILMLCGEHPNKSSFEYLLESIATAYAVRTEGSGEIRRINVEIAPLTVEEYRRLKDAGIGTYVLFQETYHEATYRTMHPAGPKADYLRRLTAMDRAMEAGIGDVGIGALFGLYDYRFEVLALLAHAAHLDKTYGVGPHTISIPRLEPAMNAPAAIRPPQPVSDSDFKTMVAILRLAVPYTGMILTTRESAALRAELFNMGVSQISAGSRTNPGGYSEGSSERFRAEQFNLGDTRTLDEVIADIAGQGHIPSFCTACYRLGRVGADFMDLAKPGLIKKFCSVNALLTFKEYLVDYASPKTRAIGDALIGQLLQEATPGIRRRLTPRLKAIDAGKRDLYI